MRPSPSACGASTGEGALLAIGLAATWVVVADRRIGLSRAKDFPWRFTLRDSPFVSIAVRRDAARAGQTNR